MALWDSVDDVLSFAIKEEEGAVLFYTNLAAQARNAAMKKVFSDFAKEEEGHKLRLQAVQTGKTLIPSHKTVMDLKVSDYLTDVEPSPDMDYEAALIVAMKKEKAAFRLYSDLATATEDTQVRDLFLGLAQEEAKHKLHFEIEYDDHMTEN